MKALLVENFYDTKSANVVARHTGGRGIMLLNANMLLFSGVVPWFDIRLNGENDDPLQMREETIVTTWNGWGQGVHGTLGGQGGQEHDQPGTKPKRLHDANDDERIGSDPMREHGDESQEKAVGQSLGKGIGLRQERLTGTAPKPVDNEPEGD